MDGQLVLTAAAPTSYTSTPTNGYWWIGGAVTGDMTAQNGLAATFAGLPYAEAALLNSNEVIGSGTAYIKACISHVSVWKSAITGTQVLNHYNALLGPGGSQSNYESVVTADAPTYFWYLTETTGTTAVDSISGNNGTYTGSFNLDILVPLGGAVTTANLRFLSVPDQDYTSVLTYQLAPPAMLEPSSVWPLPDQYLDIYNNLFLAEMFQASGNAVKADEYRKRGMAALISKFGGLSEMQRSWYLRQTISRASQSRAAADRTLAGAKDRGT